MVFVLAKAELVNTASGDLRSDSFMRKAADVAKAAQKQRPLSIAPDLVSGACNTRRRCKQSHHQQIDVRNPCSHHAVQSS
jgi:hypothetical protein